MPRSKDNLTGSMVRRLKITDEMRICAGEYDYTGWNTRMMRQQMRGMKPDGMWYSVGKSWLDWCEGESYGGIPKYIDVIKLDESKILKITTLAALNAFEKEYSILDPFIVQHNEMVRQNIIRGIDPPGQLIDQRGRTWQHIDWAKIKTQYGGIEIAPYQWQARLVKFWYYGWDCASGCVWDKNTLIDRTRLYEFDKKKRRYVKIRAARTVKSG